MNGFINIMKTPGLTSSDVVVRLRRILNQKKIGHAGTLDPAAAGVLPIMLGKATRLFDYLQYGQKEYVAAIQFGIGTDTLDAEGNITHRSDKEVDKAMIREQLAKYIGEIDQIPPKVSAVSIGGQRAYAMARKGEEVNIPARKVTIHRFDLLEKLDESTYLFGILCSKGTYIRSLCRDLAADLGTVGHLSYLLRTKSGYFGIDEAHTLESVEEHVQQGTIDDIIIKMDDPIGYMQKIELKKALYPRIINGNKIHLKSGEINGECRVYCCKEFIGLGKISSDEDGQILKIHKMLVSK